MIKVTFIILTLLFTPLLAVSPHQSNNVFEASDTLDQKINELNQLRISNLQQLDLIKFKLKYETADSFYKNPLLKDSIMDKVAQRPVF